MATLAEVNWFVVWGNNQTRWSIVCELSAIQFVQLRAVVVLDAAPLADLANLSCASYALREGASSLVELLQSLRTPAAR